MAALAVEVRPLEASIPRSGTPARLADGSLITVGGMGCAAAAAAARRLVDAGAGALLSWGMAGGLDPTLASGTIVIPGEVVSDEGAAFATAGAWREQLRTAIPGSQPVCGGRLLTAGAVLGSPAAKARAWRQMAAVAVDMESLAVAQIAADKGLPFLAVRAVVDTAADALPPTLIAAAAQAGRGRLARLLGALAGAPRELPDFIRLMRGYRAAARALCVVARSGALVPPELSARASACPA